MHGCLILVYFALRKPPGGFRKEALNQKNMREALAEEDGTKCRHRHLVIAKVQQDCINVAGQVLQRWDVLRCKTKQKMFLSTLNFKTTKYFTNFSWLSRNRCVHERKLEKLSSIFLSFTLIFFYINQPNNTKINKRIPILLTRNI